MAALFVAVLVVTAAGRLIRRNINVLMDRAPADATEAARGAIRVHVPEVRLHRLRLRQAAGRHFVDVVIGVSPAPLSRKGTPRQTLWRMRFDGRSPRRTWSCTSSRKRRRR